MYDHLPANPASKTLSVSKSSWWQTASGPLNPLGRESRSSVKIGGRNSLRISKQTKIRLPFAAPFPRKFTKQERCQRPLKRIYMYSKQSIQIFFLASVHWLIGLPPILTKGSSNLMYSFNGCSSSERICISIFFHHILHSLTPWMLLFYFIWGDENFGRLRNSQKFFSLTYVLRSEKTPSWIFPANS